MITRSAKHQAARAGPSAFQIGYSEATRCLAISSLRLFGRISVQDAYVIEAFMT